jgi:hypothetical protein
MGKVRKAPTPEQREAAAARREQFRALAKRVAELPEGERAALVARVGAVVTCEGRALSLGNTLLLVMQCPGVSMVGGFWQWKAAGRRVRKGEKGLGLWIPAGKSGEGEEVPGEAGEGSEGKGGRKRFVMGTVFDVSQTDADVEAATVRLEWNANQAAGH